MYRDLARHSQALTVHDASPGKSVLGILVKVCVDGLDKEAKVGRKAWSSVEMPRGHIRDNEFTVINFLPRHHQGLRCRRNLQIGSHLSTFPLF